MWVNDANIWSVVLGTTVPVCLTQIVIWVNGRGSARRTEKTVARTEQALEQVSVNADTAATEAASAAERALPVSNGFTAKVFAALNRVEQGQNAVTNELKEVRRRLDRHIGDHASSDVRRHREDQP